LKGYNTILAPWIEAIPNLVQLIKSATLAFQTSDYKYPRVMSLISATFVPSPDIDDLRQLNATLQKSGVAFADAIRACSVISQLHELGVGINELSEYVESSKKLATV